MDSTAVEISPGTEASSDLFGGDLFGDELLDMYHSAVVGGGGNDGVDTVPTDVLTPVLPNLIPKQKDEDGSDQTTPNPVTSTDYGGLTGFRPSTSINDFTNLLESTTASTIPAPVLVPMPQAKAPTPAAPQLSPTALQGPCNKRTHDQCNPISNINNMNPSQQQDLSSNKRRLTCHDQQHTITANTGQYTNNNLTNNQSQVIRNDGHQTPTQNTMQMSNEGVMSNVSLAPINVLSNTNTMSPKMNTIQSNPGVSALPMPQPTQPMNANNNPNSSQVIPVNQSVVTKNIISATPQVQQQQIKTEESFKVVAQAAVTNLILSAGSNPPRFDLGNNVTDSDSDSSQHLKPVNTTSAHVAALTSNNWVAACAASINNAPPGTAAAAQAAALAAANDPAAAKAARARRATLTADERARQNRDRNREHARNTRLRKKAYVEELKRTLTELVSQRDAQDLERRHEKQRDLEVREVRYRVMEEFLKLRARGSEMNLLARWVAILEDGFTLTLPKTEYRAMAETRQGSADNGSGKDENEAKQVLGGATECLEDASKVASFINTLGNSNTSPSNIVTMSYLCDRKKFMMDGVNAVLDWTLITSGVTKQGATSELKVEGRMCATFSPASNKLICAELLFDTGGISSYLKRSMCSQQIKQSTNENSINNADTSDTDALIDSVLPPVTSDVNGISSNVTIISYDKGDSSSDEDYNTQTN